MEGRTPSANRFDLAVYRKLTHIEGEVATIKAEQERKYVQHAQLMGQLTEIKSAFVKEEIKRSSELSQYKTELKVQIDKRLHGVMQKEIHTLRPS
jgi:IMP dehydrogenase/GMP reductase